MMPNPTPELPEWLFDQINKEAFEATRFSEEEKYYVNGARKYAAIAIQLRNALQEIYDLPGYRQDEASQLASEALALFPVDKKNSQENK